MPIEVKRSFAGHQMAVRISAFDQNSSKLYIDGKVVDTTSNQFGRGTLLRGVITEKRKTHIVEVRRIFPFTKPRIFVDDEEV